MKIKEQAIKELESLGPSEIVTIYEMITSLKARIGEPRVRIGEPAYLKVRKALALCKGSLSDDILLLREDKV
ncbi:MAG: hypothetical protein HY786_09185 [Deltaproteobacteria bacterium]|nr:hypothetical protein [Deltaproteobacteria bacterium]